MMNRRKFNKGGEAQTSPYSVEEFVKFAKENFKQGSQMIADNVEVIIGTKRGKDIEDRLAKKYPYSNNKEKPPEMYSTKPVKMKMITAAGNKPAVAKAKGGMVKKSAPAKKTTRGKS
jgi:hypothetical protein